MRIIFVTALLSVSWLGMAVAGPLPKYNDNENSEQSSESKHETELEDNSINSESADQSNESVQKAKSVRTLIGNNYESNESSDTVDDDLTIVKRSPNIPDVDLCKGNYFDGEKKNSREMHDEYLRYKMQQTRFRRDESAESISGESSSEEKTAKKEPPGAAAVEKASSADEAARRRRQVNGNDRLQNSSSEERRESSQEEGIQVAVDEDDKENSLEDYAQGCEVNEVNSYEANETTYNEDRRKRSSEKEYIPESRESTDDEGQEDTNKSEDDEKVKGEVAPIVNEDSDEVSKENVSGEFEGSDDISQRTKRSVEDSKESNSKSNEDSKEEKKKGDTNTVAEADKEVSSAKEEKPAEVAA